MKTAIKILLIVLALAGIGYVVYSFFDKTEKGETPPPPQSDFEKEILAETERGIKDRDYARATATFDELCDRIDTEASVTLADGSRNLSADEVRRARQIVFYAYVPIFTAHADACYSAAYWVASQCDALFLDNPLSGCGSIGAFCEIFDDRENRQTGFRWIAVYPPESKDKNLAEREALDGRTETMEKELASLVDMFRSAVLDGRPGLKKDTPGLLTGAEFRTSEALAAGLCDGMMSLADTVQAAAVRAEFGTR